MQVMVPKMTEIAAAQGSESSRQLQTSQQNAENTRAMVEADTREVHAKKDVLTVNMRTDREREREEERRGGRGKRRGAAQSGKSGPQAGVNGQGSHIDIKL